MQCRSPEIQTNQQTLRIHDDDVHLFALHAPYTKQTRSRWQWKTSRDEEKHQTLNLIFRQSFLCASMTRTFLSHNIIRIRRRLAPPMIKWCFDASPENVFSFLHRIDRETQKNHAFLGLHSFRPAGTRYSRGAATVSQSAGRTYANRIADVQHSGSGQQHEQHQLWE